MLNSDFNQEEKLSGWAYQEAQRPLAFL